MNISLFNIVTVALGGMAGSVLRYIVGALLQQKMGSAFPWGTFAVNLVGCLLIGVAAGHLTKNPHFQPWYLLLATGFCGGFTTFSAFSYESLMMFRSEQYSMLAFYIFASLLLGICLTALGYIFSK